MSRALAEALNPRSVFHAPVWGDPQAMSRALREVRKAFDAAVEERPTEDAMKAAMRKFALHQRVDSFAELKYVCYGATVPLGENRWRLVDRPGLLNAMIHAVDQQQGQVKQFRRCYQGLLNAYFGFEKNSEPEGAPGYKGWCRIREYLSATLETVRVQSRQRGSPPEWLELLHQHRNLLTDSPCEAYALELSNGRRDGLRAVCEGLGIGGTSWVWEDALMAYVRHVCAEADGAFQGRMQGVLDLVNDRQDLRLPRIMSKRATALTVARYAGCSDHPEHRDLRDTAILQIGNPWLSRSAWDAEVGHEPARVMVESWLKRRLIKDFFELLAQDGGADLRRLNYWLKFEPQISDMWFVLGQDARRNMTPEFKQLRSRMEGRGRSLIDPNSANNAFVMRIGPLLVIEFGLTGNACYVFAATDFHSNLDEMEFTLQARNPLKQKSGAERLYHSGHWESKFDFVLRRRLITTTLSADWSVPEKVEIAPSMSTRPAMSSTVQTLPRDIPKRLLVPTAAKQLSALVAMQIAARCRHEGVPFDDRRDIGGGFWVLKSDKEPSPKLINALEEAGFSHVQGQGYCFKDD